MKIKHTFPLLLPAVLLMVSCGGAGRTGSGEAIIFDYRADYPASDLTLADIADVEYIRIGKSDDFLMSGNMNALAGETYVGKDFIIKKDNNQLYMFDRLGNPIRKIGTPGRGPAEYTYLQHFVGVDEKLGEAYIYGGDNIQVYGLDGTHRRTIPVDSRGYIAGMQLLNDEEIVCNDGMRDEGFFTISRTDGKKLRTLPVTLPLPYQHDPNGAMAFPKLLRNERGTTLFDLRTDTIWNVSPRGDVHPSIVDVTKYPSPNQLYGPDNAQFMPQMENDRYIIGSVLCSPWITPDVVERNYVYDKRQQQWFTLGDGGDWYGYETIGGKICLSRAAKTLTPGYFAWYLQPIRLLGENRDKWQSPELEKVLEGVAEDDNPILMLVKFK